MPQVALKGAARGPAEVWLHACGCMHISQMPRLIGFWRLHDGCPSSFKMYGRYCRLVISTCMGVRKSTWG